MIVLLSPAKTLNFNRAIPNDIVPNLPKFKEEALELIQILRGFTVSEIGKLMEISLKLAELNYQRFKDYNQSYDNAKPCIYAYDGDVYDGIDIEKYSSKEISFANKHLRILTGLYGILRPLDLIQPYRLEMSTPLKNKYGKNLYEFWKDKITQSLNEEKCEFIINLASKEYSSAIDLKKLKIKIINIEFKVKVKSEYKNIGIFAKKARGLMANYIVENFVEAPEKIKQFAVDNYRFCSNSSTECEYIFLRD